MTLPQFWAMIFGKQIVWDERARGRDKLAQRWVQRLRFSDTHLGLANLAQLLIDAVTVQVKFYFTSPVRRLTRWELTPFFDFFTHNEACPCRHMCLPCRLTPE
jgi:hypothetical protein